MCLNLSGQQEGERAVAPDRVWTGREMADVDRIEQDLTGGVALAQKLVCAAPAEGALPENMIGELIGYRHAGVLGLPVAIKPSRIEHTVLVVHDPQSA